MSNNILEQASPLIEIPQGKRCQFYQPRKLQAEKQAAGIHACCWVTVKQECMRPRQANFPNTSNALLLT
jgi:hypothetical protein